MTLDEPYVTHASLIWPKEEEAQVVRKEGEKFLTAAMPPSMGIKGVGVCRVLFCPLRLLRGRALSR